MKRFKAWLFVWLMGEHFAEIERRFAAFEKQLKDANLVLAERIFKLESVYQPGKVIPRKPIQSRNWADFQRLAGDPDSEVQ